MDVIMNHDKITDCKLGCFLGLAVGDSLGSPIEFMEPGTFVPITCYRSGGPHGLAAGQWTDDTSMAYAMADSIIEKGWDLYHQLDNYLDWMQQGLFSVNDACFDIGTTTRAALNKFEQTEDPLNSSSKDPIDSGNGSIMRLAPVPIKFAYLYPDNIKELCRYARESSITTHGSPQCISACEYMALVLAALINGEKKDVVLSPDWDKLKFLENIDPSIEKVIKGSFRTNKVKGSGWVVGSLEAALWAFDCSNSFEEAVLKAVNLGNDSDTTGAVCGQFAGAYWGKSSFPVPLWEGLDKRDKLERVVMELIK